MYVSPLIEDVEGDDPIIEFDLVEGNQALESIVQLKMEGKTTFVSSIAADKL